ncbi:efflux RND transporter periplasmic adaptor subunit [Undibacterium sp. TJN25]|uniref:efflux RND transporter periplasmic adaptor subunit n=1 Tax=Undibacterium sp. TJN25 TaxID=3413056 RepID=UPI003BF22D2E
MKYKAIVSGVLAVVVIAGAFWWFKTRGSEDTGAEAPKGKGEEVSALVQTKAVARQQLDNTLTVYGDVVMGKATAVGFPQAGQIMQMAVVIGQQVHRGDVLATIAGDPSSQAAYTQALSAATLAANELRRNEEMLALQLATQSQVDAAKKQRQDAESNLAAQKKLGGDSASGVAKAPFDGVVSALSAAQGDRIGAGAPVMQLVPVDSSRIQFGVGPDQSRLIKAGTPVSISTVQNPAKTVVAKIKEIQSLVDAKSQLVNAIVELPPGNGLSLLPGMHVQGLVQLGRYTVWSVPRQAVLTDDKGPYLFQVRQGKAVKVAVKTVVDQSSTLGVDGPLDATLPVVVVGNYELVDGMAVREAAR